jgi:hypothetical protein
MMREVKMSEPKGAKLIGMENPKRFNILCEVSCEAIVIHPNTTQE